MRSIIGICFLASLSILAGCSGQPVSAAETFDIVYLGNLDGELEPCGCTEEGDLGGILRQTTHIDTLRKQYPDLFLLHTGGLFNVATSTDRITSRFILTGLLAQGYDAVGVQWRDLAYGQEFLARSGLPLVASNWASSGFLKQIDIRHGGRRVSYFQWLDSEKSPYRKMKGEHFKVEEKTQALAEALANAHAEGRLTVLSSGMDRDTTLARLPLENVDIVILESAYEQYGEPEMVGSTLLLQPGSRGQRIAHLRIERDGRGRIQRYEHRVTPLPATVPDASRLADWYAEFTEALRNDYRERVARRKSQARQPSSYIGEAACAECHQKAFESWKGSRHARAFSTLERENKAFDANCLGCHTVAFNQDGGFVDPEITPDRLNVQCESCHGPGRVHAESEGKQPLPRKALAEDGPVCLQCHNRSHSPSFDFATYWPKIFHGLDTPPAAQTARQ
ncbi:MAG: hypothetical protein Kow006_25630 [Gammaproteobacteria bacterium]